MITLDQLKEYLGIDSGDTSQDAYLQGLIDEISTFIETYTGRIFNQDTYTEVKDWHWERILFTKQYPLNSITSVKYRKGNDFTEWFTEVIEQKDYSFRDSGEVYFNMNLPRWFNKIEVVYNAGYASIPQDIQLWVKKLCEATYLQNQNKWVVSESVDWTSIRFADFQKNTQMNMAIFDKYKTYEI